MKEPQLDVGFWQELLESQRAVDTVDLFTHLEIYALIILAIIIQILVMYNPASEDESNKA